MKKTEGEKIPNKLEKLPGPGNTWFTFVKDLDSVCRILYHVLVIVLDSLYFSSSVF